MLFVIFKYFLYTTFKVDVFEYPLNFSTQNKNSTKFQFANTVILIDLQAYTRNGSLSVLKQSLVEIVVVIQIFLFALALQDLQV
jgi:hypothetical protein